MATLPTAHGISGLLRRAGFQRCGHSLARSHPGYRVSGDSPGRVRVDHLGTGGSYGLEDYAEAIRAAGWSVEMSPHWLVVTVKGNGNG
jgi:hypothetical protein